MAVAAKHRAKAVAGAKATNAGATRVRPKQPPAPKKDDHPQPLEHELSRAFAMVDNERSHLQTHESECRAMQRQLLACLKEKEELLSRIKAAEADKQHKEQELDSVRNENTSMQSQLEAFKSEKLAILAHLNVAKQQRQALVHQSGTVAKEVQTLRQRLSKSAEEAARQKSELKMLDDELQMLRQQFSLEEQAKHGLEQKIEAAKVERDAQRLACRRAQQQQRACHSECRAWSGKVGQDRTGALARMGSLETERQLLMSQVSDASQKKKNLEQKVGREQAAQAALQGRIASLQREIKKLTQQDACAVEASQQLHVEVLKLEEAKKALHSKLQASSSEMAAKRHGLLSEQLSPLSPLSSPEHTAFAFSPSTRDDVQLPGSVEVAQGLAAKVAAVAPDRSERASELHEPHEQHEPQEPHEPHEPQAVQAVQAISVAGSENGDELQKTSPTAPPTTEELRASSSSQQEDGSQTGEASPNVELDDLGLQLDALTELTELTELGVDLKQEGLETLEADDDGVGMKDPDQLDFENDMEAF